MSRAIPDLTTRLSIAGKNPVAFGGVNDIYKISTIKGQIVAIKLRRVNATETVTSCYERESRCWQTLRHRHVLELIGTCTFDGRPGLVSPWMSNGTALDYIKKEPNADRLKILGQASSAVEYLHEHGFCHGDIRCRNIYVNELGDALLAGFGLAWQMTEDPSSANNSMTPASIRLGESVRFLAPELLVQESNVEPKSYDPTKADVYAFGSTILELLTGTCPFAEVLNNVAVMYQVMQGQHPSRPPDFDNAVWKLCVRCWERDPSARPAMYQVHRDLSRYHVTAGTIPDLSKSLTLLEKKPLSSGKSSDVYKASTGDRQTVAVKLQRVNLTNVVKSREMRSWHNLHHPHLLRLVGTCVLNGRPGFVWPWMSNGNASQYIQKEPEADRFKILAQAGSALGYLHDCGFSHGGISGGNILINNSGDAFLAGFGLTWMKPAVATAEFGPMPTLLGGGDMLRFMAPELFTKEWKGDQSNNDWIQVDIYAFGCTILELITGQQPFSDVPDSVSVVNQVMQGQYPRRPLDFDDALWELCVKCWERNPNSRPTMHQILVNLVPSHNNAGFTTPEDEVPTRDRGTVDKVFLQLLNRLCSNPKATNSKGEPIHQAGTPKVAQPLENSAGNIVPFLFQMNSFMDAFLEELARWGFTEDVLPVRTVRRYLWTHPYLLCPDEGAIEPGGIHTWKVNGKRNSEGEWSFQPFHSKPKRTSSTLSLPTPSQPASDSKKLDEVPTSVSQVSVHNASSRGNSSSNTLHCPAPEPADTLDQKRPRWNPKSAMRRSQPVDPSSPEVAERKVKALLNKLTMERFDSISDQILEFANHSEKEQDGRTLIQVIRLVFEKATDEAHWSEMYARLCRKLMENISADVRDDGIRDSQGNHITGGHLFRKYLLDRCQENFERGWIAKEEAQASAAGKASEDAAAAVTAAKDQTVLYSDEYYAAAKAKRRSLGLVKFIGELFKLSMLTGRIIHECIKKFLNDTDNPEEEEVESLCQLISTVGQELDTPKAKGQMDSYFDRMKDIADSTNVTSRMKFMLLDVIDLRGRDWVARNKVAAPTTIAQVHEDAAKETAALEKEAARRINGYSHALRGGFRRGENGISVMQRNGNGGNFARSGAPQPSAKAASNVLNEKKDGPSGWDPATLPGRTDTSSHKFSKLSKPNAETPEASSSRRKLQLNPRTKPIEKPDYGRADAGEDGSFRRVNLPPITETQARAKAERDGRRLFAAPNLSEGVKFFDSLPMEYRHLLVDGLVTKSIDSKETDVVFVCTLFTKVAERGLLSEEAWDRGFSATMEGLDETSVDVPTAFTVMARFLKAAKLSKSAIDALGRKIEVEGAPVISPRDKLVREIARLA